jgi:tetratricopeptide (TPR) repeat protein
VFRGGFARGSASQVLGGDEPTLALLASLVRTSFLQYDREADRYRIHELLRHYGAGKLAKERTHEEEVRNLHSRHFCGWLASRKADLRGSRQGAALAEIGIELENVRSGCLWAVSHERADRIDQGLYVLGMYYRSTGALEAGEATFRTLAEELCHAVEPPIGTEMSGQWALARMYAWRSVFASLMGDTVRSQRFAQRALAILNSPTMAEQDSRAERALIWLEVGYNVRDSDPEEALVCLSRSHKLYQEIGDQAGVADALEGLGRAARNLRDLEVAERAVAESLRLRQDAGDEIGTVESMALLGQIALWEGEFAMAEDLLRRAQAIRGRDPGHYLSQTLLLAGRFEEAGRSAADSASMYLDVGQRREAAYSTAMLGQCYQHLGGYQRACAKAENALALAEGVDFGRGAGMALGLLGAVALAEGAYERARTRCEASLAVWQQSVGHPSEFEGDLACLGLSAQGSGHHDEAWEHVLSQLVWAQESRMLMPALFGLAGAARLLADEGEGERAMELYALASRYPFVANSRWFEDVAGSQMTALEARLPVAVVTAARERGQARELDATVGELLTELRR